MKMDNEKFLIHPALETILYEHLNLLSKVTIIENLELFNRFKHLRQHLIEIIQKTYLPGELDFDDLNNQLIKNLEELVTKLNSIKL